MTALNPDFWQNHFEQNHTPWDRGATSPQLMSWLETQMLQTCRVGIPGCGQGWEVATLAARGFQVVGIDYTAAAVKIAREKLSSQGLNAEIIQADVLEHQPQTHLMQFMNKLAFAHSHLTAGSVTHLNYNAGLGLVAHFILFLCK